MDSSTYKSGEVREVTQCEVCEAVLPKPLLDLGMQPLCDDLIPLGDARVSLRYPIKISLCPTCLTGHQQYCVKKETLFPKNYHYRARFTKDVLNGMERLVEECQHFIPELAGTLVCDIGCNDGSLLSAFAKKGAKTVGIEPTEAARDAHSAGHQVFNEFLSLKAVEKLVAMVGRPDVISFTNVFAHIEMLEDALQALKAMMHDGSIIVIENHYLGSILDKNQFDTFYHEHPRTYSRRSFEFIAKRIGLQVLRVTFPERYGGNIRVFLGGNAISMRSSGIEAPERSEKEFLPRFAEMQTFVDKWKHSARDSLDNCLRSGVSLSGKSFPGRAAILISLLDLSETHQHAVYEQPGSMKVGHYIPGTRIPILSDDEWTSQRVEPEGLVVWAWHIGSEVTNYLRIKGYKGRLFVPMPAFKEV